MEKNYWEKIAPSYETEIFDVLKNDKSGKIVKAILSFAGPKKSVIDIGCAVGKWMPVLAPVFGNKLHFTSKTRVVFQGISKICLCGIVSVYIGMVKLGQTYFQTLINNGVVLCGRKVFTPNAPSHASNNWILFHTEFVFRLRCTEVKK